MADEKAGGRAVLGLCAGGGDSEQIPRMQDCLAFGRKDARELIAMRYLLPLLDGDALEVAIHMLSHVTPHPDIFWGDHNWVRDEICKQVTPHFRWTVDEFCRFFVAVPWGETWWRGEIGESWYMILKEDSDFQSKLEEAAVRLAQQGKNDAAYAALHVACLLGIRRSDRVLSRLNCKRAASRQFGHCSRR